MLLNCTNHPYSIWTDRQREAAACQYGEVVDLPLPQIGPLWDSDRIRSEVDAYASRIESFQADAVLAAGEFTFIFMLVDKLLEDGVCDYVGIGKPALADPQWAKKSKEGRAEDIRPCIGFPLPYGRSGCEGVSHQSRTGRNSYLPIPVLRLVAEKP